MSIKKTKMARSSKFMCIFLNVCVRYLLSIIHKYTEDFSIWVSTRHDGRYFEMILFVAHLVFCEDSYITP